MSFDSLRFFPKWNQETGTQVYGLIHLMNDIGIINKYKPMKIAEIGNYCGESALIIGSFNFVDTLYCIDLRHKQQIKNRLECIKNNKNLIFLTGDSLEQSKKIEDNSLDMVYIDAEHDYDNVTGDLSAWHPKIKSGGFICGHDYHDQFGVKKAVDNFLKITQLNLFNIYEDYSFVIRNI